MKEIKYFCDRCNNEIVTENKFKIGHSTHKKDNEWKHFPITGLGLQIEFSKQLDLCLSCKESFNLWITNSPEKM